MDAIIFDLDGCLVDTEELHRQALVATLNRPISSEYFHEHLLGIPTSEIIRNHFSVPKDQIPELVDRKRELFAKLAKDVRLEESTRRLLSQLRFVGYRLALCSNNNMDSIFSILGKEATLFEVITSKDQCTHAKPHPEPYLRTLEHLDLPANRVVAFEDSPSGAESARAAGIQVAQITYQDLSTVYYLVKHFSDTAKTQEAV